MNRMLILYIFLLLCGTVSAQQTVEWNDLQPLTDDAHRTVYYKKDSKRPLQGKYRIIRGLDEEHVKLSDGMINGDYHRYRDGVLRESGIYVKGKRNVENPLKVVPLIHSNLTPVKFSHSPFCLFLFSSYSSCPLCRVLH